MVESILVVVSHAEHNADYIRNVINTKLKFQKLYGDKVDFACISCNDDFHVYEKYISFKYKFISDKFQVEKLCDFFTKNHDIIKTYKWFVKVRPDTFLNETIDVRLLTEGYIHGRVRIYTGPKHVINGSSVGGPGPFQNVKACFYKETEELIILDDHVIVFDVKVIENGIFNSYRENEISDL